MSDKTSANYAPALLAREDEAKRFGINSKAFEAAMRRLFEAGKIWNEPCGKPSRPSFRLAVNNTGEACNARTTTYNARRVQCPI